MTGTELVNIIKSPTSKILIFGTVAVVGALIVIPLLTRNEDPDSVRQETELSQEEKVPMDIRTNIPELKLNKRTEKVRFTGKEKKETPPPLINKASDEKIRQKPKNEIKPPKDNNKSKSLEDQFQNRNNRHNQRLQAPKWSLGSGGNDSKNTPARVNGRIFVMSAQNNSNGNDKDEVFLSENYAPFGRLLNCKLVNTLESNVEGTPLIALVIEDLWWTNSQGERKLIIPAGTEVHGRMGSCVRNRMMCEGNFILVWQITSDTVGLELQLQGRILEKSNQAGNKSKATITDMAAGIPGRVMNNNNLNEMIQYTMASLQGLSVGLQSTDTYSNGSTIVSTNDGSVKNALATALESLSNQALENVTEKIASESYYIRVAAGTEFYLYIEQVTNVEKAAIADTAINNLEQFKLAQNKNNKTSASNISQTSQLHEALGNALPKSMIKQLKGIR